MTHALQRRAYYLSGINESLNLEIQPLGLRTICFDFGYFRTEFLTADHRAPQVSRIPDYKPMTHAVNSALEGTPCLLVSYIT
jgi:hypothetical protein